MTRGRAVKNKSLRYSGVEAVEHSRVGGGYSGITPSAMLHIHRTGTVHPFLTVVRWQKGNGGIINTAPPKWSASNDPQLFRVVMVSTQSNWPFYFLFISSFSVHPCTPLVKPLLALTHGQERGIGALRIAYCGRRVSL